MACVRKYNYHCCHYGDRIISSLFCALDSCASHNHILNYERAGRATMEQHACTRMKRNICRAHVTASNNCSRGFLMVPCSAFAFCAGVGMCAINSFCACMFNALTAWWWQKKIIRPSSTHDARSNDDENGNFSASNIIETEILSSSRLLFLLCRWLPPDPWLGYVSKHNAFQFFWSFSFLLQHVSATGENCRERYFHYGFACTQQIDGKTRFFSCCFFFSVLYFFRQ